MTSYRTECLSSDRYTFGKPVVEKGKREPQIQQRNPNRRVWISIAAATAAAIVTQSSRIRANPFPALPFYPIPSLPKFGLVTYLWGKDMDVSTLIEGCLHSGMTGVELRTEHKHAVEPGLSAEQRRSIRKQFEASGVQLIGYGSNCEFHSDKKDVLQANIKLCKEYIRLMHDCGGTGVKVKPNAFVSNVPREQTIEQIGRALNELAEYGQKYGQQIRLEVHGPGTSELSVVRDIFQVADHKNAVVCWNSNNEDLSPPGLAANFEMVRPRFGETVHVRELNLNDYPYQELINLLITTKYTGWVLMEARTDPSDKFAAMKQQREIFDSMLKIAGQAIQAPQKSSVQ